MINKKDVVIYPLVQDRITGVGYDLSIGKMVPLSQIDNYQDVNNIIKIPPKSHCLIVTEEFVWISKRYVGTLHARGTLAAKGLYGSATTVDPNFKGQMIMSVYNISDVDIIIDCNKNPTFITLILHSVNTPTTTLINNEEAKNAKRVVHEMFDEIYSDQAKYVQQRKSIDEVYRYLTKSNDTRYRSFDQKVESTKHVFNPYYMDKVTFVKNSFRDYFEGGFYQAIKISSLIFCFGVLISFILDYLKGLSVDLRVLAVLLAAIITLFDKTVKKK